MTHRRFTLIRHDSGENHTAGMLFESLGPGQLGPLLCYTLENGHRAVKVPGETRIPAGTYRLRLRTWGGFHERYKKLGFFKAIHLGMLELLSVPQYTDILIHTGNSSQDTKGCILVGNEVTMSGKVWNSVSAYQRLYPVIANHLAESGTAELQILDLHPQG